MKRKKKPNKNRLRDITEKKKWVKTLKSYDYYILFAQRSRENIECIRNMEDL